jgi:hypothetical protein
VVGKHYEGKSHDDVKQVFFDFQNCPYLPLDIGKFFTNLEIFYLKKSNVQHILPGDLESLDKLNVFDVSHNPVEEIPKDFFAGHETITKISFYDCHLKEVEKGALEPLKNLDTAYFDYNECINAKKESVSGMQSFIANVYEKCSGEGYYLKRHGEDKIIKEFIATASESISPTPGSPENSSIITIGIIFITILSLTVIILSITLLKVYRNYFHSNWQEMRNIL